MDTKPEQSTDERLQAALWTAGILRQAMDEIVEKTRPLDVEGDVNDLRKLTEEFVTDIYAIASSARARCGMATGKPPVPWEVHFGLQAAFVKLAEAMGVRIDDGRTFIEALDQCHGRARVAGQKADQWEAVLALLDGSVEALRYGTGDDTKRAVRNIERAISLLKTLAKA